MKRFLSFLLHLDAICKGREQKKEKVAKNMRRLARAPLGALIRTFSSVQFTDARRAGLQSEDSSTVRLTSITSGSFWMCSMVR